MESFAVWTSSVSDNRCWEETHPIANLVLDDCFERVFCDNYYTENRWGEAKNYDLCLNAALGLDACADLIVDAAKAMNK